MYAWLGRRHNQKSPVTGYTLEDMEMPGVDSAGVQQARAMMERQVQHLVRLVDDLLDVSRILRNRIELRKERMDLASLGCDAVPEGNARPPWVSWLKVVSFLQHRSGSIVGRDGERESPALLQEIAMLRFVLLCGLMMVLAAALLMFGSAPAKEPQPPSGKSALEQDPKGWVDLLPGKDLRGWKRVPIPPDRKLNAKNPWSLADDGRTLLCDGVGVKEMLLHEQARTDGIFHVEWRFQKVAAQTGYNSGVYVRTAADGTVWHQAQVAHLDKPPLLGDLFGETRVDGQVKHFQIVGKGHQLARPPGEWNTYEITCKGKAITVRVNGAVATAWDDC